MVTADAFGAGRYLWQRFEAVFGLIGLAVGVVVPPLALLVLLTDGPVLPVLSGFALAAPSWTMWAGAWRKSVDMPMGEAWSDLSVVRRLTASCWTVVGLVNLAEGRATWALFDFVVAALSLRRGRGNDGWDDVPAPEPAPSDGMSR